MFAGYRLYIAALLASLPVVLLLGAMTPLAVSPHWPGARSTVLMVAVSPVVEEIVFRAGLQDGLAAMLPARSLAGVSPANILTAVVFALAHLWHHPPLWALATAVPALVFGAFYERHAHLAAPIGLHAAYNAVYLLVLQPV